MRFVPTILILTLAAPGCRNDDGDPIFIVNTGPAPGLTVTAPAGTPEKGAVAVDFNLFDPQSDDASVSVEYSSDGGFSWAPCTPTPDSPAMINLPTTPSPGLPYTFIWNSMADGVAISGSNPDVRLRLTPSNTDVGTAQIAGPFEVDNSFSLSTLLAGTELSDAGKFLGMTLNAAGNARIAYHDATNGTLRLAEFDGANWSYSVVDANDDPGYYPSIVIGGDGEPRIAYYTPIGELRFAQRSAGVWSITTVDAGPLVGQYPSLTLDGADNPHIAYYDGAQGDLKYASNTGAWSIQTVDATNNVGAWSSLELDGAGNPVIVYYDATNGDLLYAAWNGASWDFEIIDATGDVGRHCDLELTSTNEAYVSYYDLTNGDLLFARRNGGAWPRDAVDTVGNVGVYCSIALDSTDAASISYRDLSLNLIKNATRSGVVGPFAITFVDTSGPAQGDTAHRFDGADIPCVAYYDGQDLDVKFAVDSGGGWSVQRVDGSPAVFADIDISVDSAYISKIAFRGTTASASSALRLHDGVSVVTVDSAIRAGERPSMVVDSLDQIHIAYEDELNGDLKYAVWNGGAWSVVVVETLGPTGRHPSIALDASEAPHIAYHRPGAGLRLASWNGATWDFESIDPTGGLYASLQIGADPSVAYYDPANGDLKYASRSGAVWTIEVVESTGDVGAYASMSGSAIAYFDATNANLNLAEDDGVSWQLDTPASGGLVGKFAVLRRDSVGVDWLAYYDETGGIIRIRWRKNGGPWSVRTLDTVTVTPGEKLIGLALDPSGQPRLAWSDGGALRLGE